MRRILVLALTLHFTGITSGQINTDKADSLKRSGMLIAALGEYASLMLDEVHPDLTYDIASTAALLWTSQMRDTAFHYLGEALKQDSSLDVLFDPEFLSLIDDPRWSIIEDQQIAKYSAVNGPIRNEPFARELFRMIIKDQGLMYFGNIERRKYIRNGGHFGTPAIYPLLAMEERNMEENKHKLLELLEKYGWPTASEVTEYAAAGAALIINHTDYALRSKYFPMLEEAFQKGEAQPLRYAKMRDRLLVEEGKEQLYGTQIKFEELVKEPYPIKDPTNVDFRRKEIGLGSLGPYLKARFDIDWEIPQND